MEKVMREKTIFDGRIDGSSEEIQEIIDFFLFQNIGLPGPGIDYRVEDENQKRLYVIYPPQDENRIINGYTEINTPSLSDNKPVNDYVLFPAGMNWTYYSFKYLKGFRQSLL
jgi:hypothetical protein